MTGTTDRQRSLAIRLRESARSWRSFAYLISLVAAGGIFYVNYQTQSLFGRANMEAALLSSAISWLAVMLVIWPYFILTRLMEGVAGVLDGTESERTAGETFAAISLSQTAEPPIDEEATSKAPATEFASTHEALQNTLDEMAAHAATYRSEFVIIERGQTHAITELRTTGVGGGKRKRYRITVDPYDSSTRVDEIPAG